ncbi:MAG: radical SAM family heme chaperone HemW [Balneola sp.]
MSGIYIHIPFCKQACSYCDFYFVTKTDQKSDFVEKLIEEIRSKKDSVYTKDVFETIYFGGGTPSLLSVSQIEKILEAINVTFQCDLQEVTVELNPDNVTADYLAGLKAIGVNRVSMGVQTFDEDLLLFMNRTHNSKEALRCLELLKKSDINVFTADLIYGNPGQTPQMLEKDLETLLRFEPPHVSAYSLTIEPKTRLGKQLELGRLIPAEDQTVEQHFEIVERMLNDHNIFRYEVSNFAKKGSEAKHNSKYWEHKNYLGLGPGAHSFWWEEDGKKARRWENESNLKHYLSQTEFTENNPDQLTLSDLAEERLMLALRTRKGITIQELETKYDFHLSEAQKSYLSNMKNQGKLHWDDTICLSSSGLKIADAITLDLITI